MSICAAGPQERGAEKKSGRFRPLVRERIKKRSKFRSFVLFRGSRPTRANGRPLLVDPSRALLRLALLERHSSQDRSDLLAWPQPLGFPGAHPEIAFRS